MVVQRWHICNVAVVGHVEGEANDLSRCGSLHGVVNGWVHRDLHVVEFVNGNRQHDGVADSRFTAAGIGIDFLREGLQHHGVFTCWHAVWHVHRDIKLLIGVRGEFLQRFSWNLDIPNDINAEGIGDPCEAEVKAVRSVSVVGHRDR